MDTAANDAAVLQPKYHYHMWWLRVLFLLALSVSLSAAAQVYRCGSTYQQELCSGGRSVDTSPAISDPAGPSQKRIYLCSRSDGAYFWVHEHCSRRGWAVEDMQTVSARIDWDGQVEQAQRQREQAQSQYAPARHSAPQQIASGDVRNQCDYLDERVRRLDEMGRAGSRYYDLNWVRSERQKARDAQFRLRCGVPGVK